MKLDRIHIGTSGWHYDHWRGPFYPEDMQKKDFLGFYAERFRTVEINNTFYQLPNQNTLKKWRDTTPPGFLFSAKGSRYVTHMKKLKDPDKSLQPLLKALGVLEKKLGPIIFQLPPRWGLNLERLEAFLRALPGEYRYALELRDPSWLDPRAYELMEDKGVAFCMYELAGRASPREITADFVYVRLHGPGDAYQGNYSTQTLAGWAGAFSTWVGQGREVFCYFDNDQAGYAAQNALALQNMLTKG